MKLVIDENISFAEEAFGNFGDIILLNGRKIDNKILKDADALIVRSITNVDEALLKNTGVKFVGTATIGTDHIDLDYLNQKNIVFTSAAGCNSYAVTEYVFTAVSSIIHNKRIEKGNFTLGIVGFGNIGSKVARYAESMGIETCISDPPLERKGIPQKFQPLKKVLESDIITFHVPLNMDGEDRTYHLLDEANLQLLNPGTILINSSRGPVVDNKALLKRLQKENDLYAVLDVWENEPDFIPDLLENIIYGTPHIAGYSLEGKVNGTKIVYDALCKFFGLESGWSPTLPSVEKNIIDLDESKSKLEILYSIFENVYSINEDDLLLRNSLNMAAEQKKEYFDKLRKNYKYRRELNNYKLRFLDSRTDEHDWLKEFRLKILD